MSNIDSEVKQTKEIVFCDYIQVTDSVDDEYIFNVVCISNQGLGLKRRWTIHKRFDSNRF